MFQPVSKPYKPRIRVIRPKQSENHSSYQHVTKQVGTLNDAIERINILEEENKTKEELIKKLENEAERLKLISS